MRKSDSWPHVVYTKTWVDDRKSRMQSWCELTCEGMWCHVYVSWQHEAWGFSDSEDELKFRLTWHDYVDNHA
jgi:hypothetical protein